MFPTSYSTLDAAALADHVSKAYSLPPCTCKLLLRGVGDTYLISAPNDKYILRVYRNTHRTLEHIEAEVELLLALKQGNVSVSYPIHDANGNAVQVFDAAEGKRHAVLFTYAAGEPATRLTDDQIKTLGHEMARLHLISSTLTLKYDRWDFDTRTTLTEPMDRVRPILERIPDELTWWLHATSQARSELDSISDHHPAKGYCHYDLLPKNFHFEGNQITFFDFDFFGHGWLVNDLMTFWTQLCIDVQFNRLTRPDAERSFSVMLDAYRKVRPCTEYEVRSIPALQVAWWCFFMGFHASHDQFMAFAEPAHLKMRTALIRQCVKMSYDFFS